MGNVCECRRKKRTIFPGDILETWLSSKLVVLRWRALEYIMRRALEQFANYVNYGGTTFSQRKCTKR